MAKLLPDPSAFGFCRAIGHAWSQSWTLTRETGAIQMRLRCTQCPTERRDLIDPRTGELLGRSYSYPDGYLTKGSGRTHVRTDYRREYVGWLLSPGGRAVTAGDVVDLRKRRRRSAS